MSRKYLICIICVVFLGENASSQYYLHYQPLLSNGQYGPTTQFVSGDVSSDFGRRRGNHTLWHNGIDYNHLQGNNDLGDHLLSPFTGLVHRLTVQDGFKYIVLTNNANENLGFGHIFVNGSTYPQFLGDFVLSPTDEEVGYAIIDLTNGIAFGPINNLHVTIPNHPTYTVTNQVSVNDPIAPMGNSGVNITAHLHLYMYRNINLPNGNDNCLNPLEIINHDQPQYDVEINQLYNLNEYGNSPTQAGNLQGSIRVRCSMINPGVTGSWTFSNSVMNVENVSIYIKKDYQPISCYQLIQGENFNSYISNGGRLSNHRYPSPQNPESNQDYDIAADGNVGSTTLTGIDPIAYSSDFTYDDYYYSDFYTRIRKDCPLGQIPISLARSIEEAKYPDGVYDLFAQLTTVRDVNWPNSQQYQKRIIIDNFIPYVQKVEMFYGDQIYSAGWNWDPNTQRLIFSKNSTLDGEVNTNHISELSIRVYFSESMDNSTAISVHNKMFPNTTIPVSSFQPIANTNDQVWQCLIPYPNINSAVLGDYYLSIDGHDLASNPLGGYNENQQIISTIPIRQQNNIWDPLPTFIPDTKHSFSISNSVVAKCDFTATPTVGTYVQTVTFTDLSSGPLSAIAWDWKFGDGSTSTEKNPVHEYRNLLLDPMSFFTSLHVTYSDQTEKTCTKSNYITIYPSGYTSLTSKFTLDQLSQNAPSIVKFHNNSYSHYAIAYYLWDFGDGTTSTLKDPPDHIYDHAGIFNVRLTVTDIYQQSADFNMSVTVNEYCLNGVVVDFTLNPSQAVVGQGVEFEPSVLGYSFDCTYLWDFGDNSFTSTFPRPCCVYQTEGNYNVILKVYSSDNSLLGTCCHNIQVIPYCLTTPPAPGQILPWNKSMSTSCFGKHVANTDKFVAIGSFGKFFVYKNVNDQWIPSYSTDGCTESWFGSTVDLDNNLLLASCIAHNANQGRVYCYQYNESSDSWAWLTDFGSSDYQNDKSFGLDLAIHDNNAVIVAINNNFSSPYHFRVYCYSLVGSVWNLDQTINDAYVGTNFPSGHEVKFDNDNLILYGKVYNKINGLWVNPVLLQYGNANSISEDFILTEAYPFVKFFKKNGTSFNFNQKLYPPYMPSTTDDIAIWNNYSIISSTYVATNPPGGRAYLYRNKINSPWSVQTIFAPSANITNDDFGYSISMSNDYAFVGAPAFQSSGPGSVYYFKYKTSVCDQTISKCSYTYDQNYGTIYAQMISLAGQGCAVSVQPTSIIHYVASTISLKEGFSAIYGSNFVATATTMCNGNNCNNLSDSSSINHINSDSLKLITNEDLCKEKIRIYPNPSDGVVNIYYTGTLLENADIDIFSSIGSLVYQKPKVNFKSFQVNLVNFSAGFYLIRITQNHRSLFFKIIKE